MSEVLSESQKRPGIVIFVSILNFFSAATWFFVAALFVTLLIFGNAVNFYQTLTNQLQERLASQNLSIGLNVIFSFFLSIGLIFGIYHLLLGLGLLKAKGAAWYVQVVTAIFGLILLPYGTILSVLILIFFFQANVRNYFKV